MQILRQQDYHIVPWRNGAGETSEIAVWPEAATGEDVAWRISMAPVVVDGPFSVFPGIDRILTIISGTGMTLSVGGSTPVRLHHEPFAFPGDTACTATLPDGPITDLNVMTRRGEWRADVRHMMEWQEDRSADHHMAFAAHGPVTGTIGGRDLQLNDRDTLWLSGPEAAGCRLSGRWLDIRLYRLIRNDQLQSSHKICCFSRQCYSPMLLFQK